MLRIRRSCSANASDMASAARSQSAVEPSTSVNPVSASSGLPHRVMQVTLTAHDAPMSGTWRSEGREMISKKSPKREIKDLQRLLLAVGLMEFTSSSKSGVWGDETQEAVLAEYTHLGWDHPAKGKWISAPALAAVAAALHRHDVDGTATSGGVGGSGSHIGGSGSHIGGSGSHIGGSGSH